MFYSSFNHHHLSGVICALSGVPVYKRIFFMILCHRTIQFSCFFMSRSSRIYAKFMIFIITVSFFLWNVCSSQSYSDSNFKKLFIEKVCLYNSIYLWFSMTLNLDFMPFLWFYSQNCQFYDFLWFYARWDPCIIDSQKLVTILWSKYLNKSFKSMHDIQFNLSMQPCFWIILN